MVFGRDTSTQLFQCVIHDLTRSGFLDKLHQGFDLVSKLYTSWHYLAPYCCHHYVVGFSTNALRFVKDIYVCQGHLCLSRSDVPQRLLVASSAPSTSARSLAQATSASTWSVCALVPKPQSTPAMIFSRPSTVV